MGREEEKEKGDEVKRDEIAAECICTHGHGQ